MVDASIHDLPLYKDLFKVTAVTLVAGVLAYMVRNLIAPRLLIPRILAVGVCVSAIYLPALFLLRLPGWEMLTKERISSFVRSTLGRLGFTTA